MFKSPLSSYLWQSLLVSNVKSPNELCYLVGIYWAAVQGVGKMPINLRPLLYLERWVVCVLSLVAVFPFFFTRGHDTVYNSLVHFLQPKRNICPARLFAVDMNLLCWSNAVGVIGTVPG